MPRPLIGIFLAGVLALAACGGGPADGWVSVGTGDTYGEWELFAEAKDGSWTGCLRLAPGPKRCTSPDTEFVRFEDGYGAAFGVAPEEGTLVHDDAGEVALMEPGGFDRKFYVVADNANIRVRP